jgi:predicted transcriptional regulator
MPAEKSSRRSDMRIDASILECALTESRSRYRISVLVNLNGDTTKRHVDALVSKGRLQIAPGSKRYKKYSTTAKGIRWLRTYRNLEDEDESSGQNDKKDRRPDFM